MLQQTGWRKQRLELSSAFISPRAAWLFNNGEKSTDSSSQQLK
jgi:hypothetical protein